MPQPSPSLTLTLTITLTLTLTLILSLSLTLAHLSPRCAAGSYGANPATPTRARASSTRASATRADSYRSSTARPTGRAWRGSCSALTTRSSSAARAATAEATAAAGAPRPPASARARGITRATDVAVHGGCRTLESTCRGRRAGRWPSTGCSTKPRLECPRHMYAVLCAHIPLGYTACV